MKRLGSLSFICWGWLWIALAHADPTPWEVEAGSGVLLQAPSTRDLWRGNVQSTRPSRWAEITRETESVILKLGIVQPEAAELVDPISMYLGAGRDVLQWVNGEVKPARLYLGAGFSNVHERLALTPAFHADFSFELTDRLEAHAGLLMNPDVSSRGLGLAARTWTLRYRF